MTPIELMLPRYKVTALWFNSPSKIVVGDIFNYDEFNKVFYCKGEVLLATQVKKYPHLLKELSWWEYRKLEDMPEYVSYKFLEDSEPKLLKVDKHFLNSFGEDNSKGFMAGEYFHSYSKSLPITKIEYENKSK